MGKSSGRKLKKRRHKFFLNPYEDIAFTKCPHCGKPTKLRKFPLVIHIDPDQFFLLHKRCRFCPSCDLLIAKKEEIEPIMAAAFEERRVEIIGNEYVVIGTMERADWKASTKGDVSGHDIVERTYIFKDVVNFKVDPGGWGRVEGKP